MKITVAFTETVPFLKKKGSALKRKEFAPMEHLRVAPLRRATKMKMAKLLPLKVHQFILKISFLLNSALRALNDTLTGKNLLPP